MQKAELRVKIQSREIYIKCKNIWKDRNLILVDKNRILCDLTTSIMEAEVSEINANNLWGQVYAVREIFFS